MDKNIWGNYMNLFPQHSPSSSEINAWLKSTMDCMDDLMIFSKKICEMKATPDDVMLLWKNSTKKIQGSMAECMKIMGVADNSAIEETEKKLADANKTIDDQKKKMKDQEKEMASQKKEIDKLNSVIADQKKEMSKMQQTIASLESTAVKTAAAPKTNQ